MMGWLESISVSYSGLLSVCELKGVLCVRLGMLRFVQY